MVVGWWPLGLYVCSVSPSPSPSQSLSSGLWILDFVLEFGAWIWGLDLRLGFGTGLELDNKEMFVRGLNC